MSGTLDFETRSWAMGYEWVPFDDWRIVRYKGEDVDFRQIDDEIDDKILKPEYRLCLGSDNSPPRILLRHRGDLCPEMLSAEPLWKNVGPLDPAAFRNFAALTPTPEQVIRFAGKYGSLFATSGNRSLMIVGEPFAEWLAEVRAMRAVVELWEHASNPTPDSTKAMAEHFKKLRDGSLMQSSLWLSTYRKYQSKDDAVQATVLAPRGTSIVDATKLLINNAVNVRLRELGVSVQLMQRNGLSRLTMQAKDLLSALWIQCALMVSEGNKYRQCEACGEWMELSLESGRADKKYCDTACRNRGMRQRQARAIELRNSGETVKQIAVKLESDVETIKNWLTLKKGK